MVDAGGRLGRREWVLPRAKLLYRRFDLCDVPPARRARVLALKLEAWQPVAVAQFWTGWQGGIAHVWAWPGGDAELDPAGRDVPVPESVLHPPASDGMRLVECLEGFEGQYWQAGILRQSRWWPVKPDAAHWHTFMRAARLMPHDEPPPAQPLAWQQRPWARAGDGGQGWWQQNERAVVSITAVLLALGLGWQLGGLWQAKRALATEQARLEALQQESSEELAARDRALQEQARAADLLALLPEVDALQLLDQVTAALPPNIRLREWRFEPGELAVTLEGEKPPDPETAVRAFESVELLDDVMVERGRAPNTLELRAGLTPEAAG